MLRVTDKLFELSDVITLDNFQLKFDSAKHIHMEKLRQFMKNEINVHIDSLNLELTSIQNIFKSLQGPKDRL